MRGQNKAARGVYVYVKTLDSTHWHNSSLSPLPFFSDRAIYSQALHLFETAPGNIREIGVHCYELADDDFAQMSLFADDLARERYVANVVDDINSRFGERTLHAANTLSTGIYVNQKIPFGSTRYL